MARIAQRQRSVCFVTNSYGPRNLLAEKAKRTVGGAEVQVTFMARQLARRGWAVSCTVSDEGQSEVIHGADDVRLVRGYRDGGGVPGLRRATHKLPRLWRAFGLADASIYVVRGASWFAGAIALFARLKGRRIVLWMANDRDPVWGLPECKADVNGVNIGWIDAQWWTYALAHADAVVAQTADQAKLLQRARGVDATVIRNLLLTQDSGVPKAEPPLAVWAGNFRPVKQPQLLVETARLAPEVRFEMLGGPHNASPTLFEECQRTASGLPNLQLPGHLPFEQADRRIAEASVLLLTSESEGFPNVLLQAWSHGTPTVSTIDPDGIIANKELGYQCSTPAELADATRKLVSAPALRDEMGERAREYVAKNHSPEIVLGQLEALLLGLVGEPGEPQAADAATPETGGSGTDSP